MAKVTDGRLQDYLDGRLSDRERAEVEAALGDDPELARRVAAWGEIGSALRSGDDELPPGFYARARERFEQTRPRSRFGFRILSWEVAGLAAAVLLAGVVFIPEMMRDPELGRAPAAPAEPRSDTARADSPSTGEPSVRLESKTVARDVVAPDDASPVPETTLLDEVASIEEAENMAKEEIRETVREPAKQKLRAELGPEPAAAGRVSAVAPPERSRGQAAAPAPAEIDADVVEPEQEGIGRFEDSERLAQKTAPSRPKSDAADEELPRVVALPASAAPPEGLTVLDTRPEWETWLAGAAGPALSVLGSPDPAKRLVVVGQATGLDCSALRPARLEHRYSLRLTAGSSVGCALLLPRDGLPVTLE